VKDIKDINVVIGGTAGEGVQTIGDVLAETVSSQGYAVLSWKEYESGIRGGLNSCSVRIGENPQNAPLTDAGVLLALNREAVKKYQNPVGPGAFDGVGASLRGEDRGDTFGIQSLERLKPAASKKKGDQAPTIRCSGKKGGF
jgi:2-oxoglutarate ferredoxin oxidoreductase subunit alpha